MRESTIDRLENDHAFKFNFVFGTCDFGAVRTETPRDRNDARGYTRDNYIVLRFYLYEAFTRPKSCCLSQ